MIKNADFLGQFFEELSIGCSLQELICDASGTPIDYVALDVNKTCVTEKLTQ